MSQCDQKRIEGGVHSENGGVIGVMLVDLNANIFVVGERERENRESEQEGESAGGNLLFLSLPF